ncbi:hypothetical protein Ssi02_71380 [Sinosporangium siamense]|uniref:Uncharacterized protein n=1 Tax=Sinosporangium siamense TaxID=1367973 RepID=A0A919RN98_9ACTN|nr:hypothetical protein Ssi02_71380 [Sinosporangium siamense]
MDPATDLLLDPVPGAVSGTAWDSVTVSDLVSVTVSGMAWDAASVSDLVSDAVSGTAWDAASVTVTTGGPPQAMGVRRRM